MQAIKESLLWVAAANTEVSDMCISSLQGTPVTRVGQMKNVEMAQLPPQTLERIAVSL